MTDLASFVGAAGEPFSLPVERGKIREFARATRSRNPEFLDAARPTVPPTFLMTAVFWQTAANLALGGAQLDATRGLHAEQSFMFHGPPPRAGDELTGRQRVDRVTRKSGRRGGAMTFVELVTEYRDAAGTLRAESRTTLVQTSRAVGARH